MRLWNPGISVFVTNRCEEERFFLLPKPRTKRLILSWLAKALARFPGIHLHAFIFMGNHFHLLLTDTRGELADFMDYLQGQLGRAINRDVLRRRGHFWSDTYSAIPVLTDADFEERYAYILTNACKPGLVARAEESPFVSSYKMSFTEEPLTCRWLNRTKRNDLSRGGREVDESRCLEEYDIKLTIPEMWRGLSKARRSARIAGLVKAKEQQYGKQRAAEGKRGVLGVRRILEQNPYMRPQKPARSPAPRVFCRDPELKREYLEGLRQVVGLYREAFDGFARSVAKKRKPLIEWPPGTYPPSMRRPIGAPA